MTTGEDKPETKSTEEKYGARLNEEQLDDLRHMLGASAHISKRQWGFRNHFNSTPGMLAADIAKLARDTSSASGMPDWIPVSERKPHSNDGRLLLLIRDKSVAIENFATAGHMDLSGNFWSGVPGNWLDLAATRWEVTHWKPASNPLLFAAPTNNRGDQADPVEGGSSPGDLRPVNDAAPQVPAKATSGDGPCPSESPAAAASSASSAIGPADADKTVTLDERTPEEDARLVEDAMRWRQYQLERARGKR